MVLVLYEKYKPLWLSSREGWYGGSIRGKRLFPYAAMCPHGPGVR